MSKHANPTIIGSFVVGAIALAIFTLIVLGGGKIFSERSRFVTYFDGSIQGLREGANVNFRGVRIGQVRKVFVRFDESMLQFDLPVILELEPGAILSVYGEKITKDESGKMMKTLIERGLRAKLQIESFVTGQLLVELDFYPEEPPVFRGQDNPYQEIPTIPSGIQLALEQVQKFMEKLEDLPVEDLLKNITSTAQGFDRLVNSPELYNTLEGLDKFINSPETQRLSKSLQSTIETLDATIAEVQEFVDRFDKKLNPAVGDAIKTMEDIQAAANAMQNFLKDFRNDFKDDTFRYELSTALDELRNAARSFRIFVEYLDTHPEALLQGKQNAE